MRGRAAAAVAMTTQISYPPCPLIG